MLCESADGPGKHRDSRSNNYNNQLPSCGHELCVKRGRRHGHKGQTILRYPKPDLGAEALFNFKRKAVDTSMRVTGADQLIFQFFRLLLLLLSPSLFLSLSVLHFLSNLSGWNYQTNHIAGLSPAMPQLFWSVWRDAAEATKTPRNPRKDMRMQRSRKTL